MSNDILQAFTYQGKEVRTVVKDGETYFLLADIREALALDNNNSVVSRVRHDDGVAIHHPIQDRLGRTQDAVWISEAGLYKLAFQSKVPAAEHFTDWVTHEVLPSIRRRGGYLTPEATEQALTDPDFIIQLATQLKEERKRREVLSETVELQKPLVAQAKTYAGGENLTARQPFAREIITWAIEQGYQVKQQDVFRFLSHKLGLFVRGERADAGEATTEAIRRGYAVTNKGTSMTGHNFATGKLTAKGKQYAWERITRYLEQNGTLELLKVAS